MCLYLVWISKGTVFIFLCSGLVETERIEWQVETESSAKLQDNFRLEGLLAIYNVRSSTLTSRGLVKQALRKEPQKQYAFLGAEGAYYTEEYL